MANIAITRAVSRAIDRCELSHLHRSPIDLELARSQHDGYEQALRDAGCDVRQLAVQPDWPDSVFVEDTAIVLKDVAVSTRPGAESRREEVASVAEALADFRELRHIDAPATLDGGDVLRLGGVLHVGVSARSNLDGIAQLEHLVGPFGYSVAAVPLKGCLHLKSAVTQVAEDLLLVNPDWVDAGRFEGWRNIAVDAAEPHAANTLQIGGRLIMSTSWPRTAARLRQAGIDVHAVGMSEMEKAEGGVTCCSLMLDA